jgi:hypothetical protein
MDTGDSELRGILNAALTRAMDTIDQLGRQDILADEIARLILRAAEAGERDPDRLSDLALTEVGILRR